MPEVRLRPIRITDAEVCFRWVNDPDVGRHLGLLHTPATVDEERAWIGSMLADKAQYRVFVVEDRDGRPIGTGSLRGIDAEAGVASLGLMIGEKTIWGQGYGTAATKALLACAFGELGLRQVRLACHSGNYRALRCYQKAGFTASSRKQRETIFGRREVRMEISRERWEELARSGAG